jgi:hypothetical protein
VRQPIVVHLVEVVKGIVPALAAPPLYQSDRLLNRPALSLQNFPHDAFHPLLKLTHKFVSVSRFFNYFQLAAVFDVRKKQSEDVLRLHSIQIHRNYLFKCQHLPQHHSDFFVLSRKEDDYRLVSEFLKQLSMLFKDDCVKVVNGDHNADLPYPFPSFLELSTR